MRVLLASLYSGLMRVDRLKDLHRDMKILVEGLYDSEIEASSLEEVTGKAAEFDAVIVLVLSGGVEEMILALSEGKRPLIAVAHDQMNSLPAALEAASELKQMDAPIWIVGSWIPGARKRVESLLAGVRAWIKLKGMRLGLIGDPSPWLVYSRIDPRSLEKRFGVKILKLSMEELYSRIDPQNKILLEHLLQRISEDISKTELIKALRLYGAMSRLVEEYGLEALTLRCFDVIKDLGTTACLALALLNDKGIVAGCEGDLPGLMAMILGKLISGSPTFIANLVKTVKNDLILAHCTIPLTILDEYSLTTHFESEKGVAVSGRLPIGKVVTLLRFGRDLSVLRTIKGIIVDGSSVKGLGCRTQLRIRIGGDAEKLVDDPLGNHHVMVLGDVSTGVRAFCDLNKIKFEAW